MKCCSLSPHGNYFYCPVDPLFLRPSFSSRSSLPLSISHSLNPPRLHPISVRIRRTTCLVFFLYLSFLSASLFPASSSPFLSRVDPLSDPSPASTGPHAPPPSLPLSISYTSSTCLSVPRLAPACLTCPTRNPPNFTLPTPYTFYLLALPFLFLFCLALEATRDSHCRGHSRSTPPHCFSGRRKAFRAFRLSRVPLIPFPSL